MLVEYAELHGRFSLACNRLHNVISVLVLVKPHIVAMLAILLADCEVRLEPTAATARPRGASLQSSFA
jgi:hypothetical protein